MKILCIGRNYANHAKELNNKIPTEPLIFMKPETALNKTSSFEYPSFTNDLHYELELVLKINKSGKAITLENASNHYSEIALGIDFTARDIQSRCKEKGHPWEKAKAFDNSASLGEFVKLETLNKSEIVFSLQLNEEEVQLGNSKDMIFDFDYLIHYASQFFSLEIGDLIYTGTPAGVGPVSKGDKLTGYLADDLLLEVVIN